MSDQENSKRDGMDDQTASSRSSDRDHEHSCDSDSWWEDRSLPEKIFLGICFGILGIGLIFLFGFVVMKLWNWLMPEIFGLKRVDYWQAWGLLILSCILFGKIGGSGDGGRRSDRKRRRKLRSYIREERFSAGEEAAGSRGKT